MGKTDGYYENMDIGEYGGAGGGGVGEAGTPESLETVERRRYNHRRVDDYCRAQCPCLSARFTVSVMACLGFIIQFGMKTNLPAAKLQLEQSGPPLNQSSIVTDKDVNAGVDMSFFFGYLFTQIPGGYLTSVIPANRMFGTAIVISSILHLFSPSNIVHHTGTVMLIRFIQGLVEGVTYPSCHGIWRFWAPPLERSRLATLAFSGSYAGIVIGLPLSNQLATYSYEAPFYFYGFAGIVWYGFWLFYAFEKPELHPSIETEELKYIQKSLGESVNVPMPKLSTTPFYSIATSLPVYAIIVANFCRSYNFYMLVGYQNKYMENKWNSDAKIVGFESALPHLIMTCIVPIGGLLADHLRKNDILSTTNVRKLFNCGGFGIEGLSFLVTAFAQSKEVAVLSLTVGIACSGFAISGYNVNHLDIAPRYASILMGLSNGIGTIAGAIVSAVVDALTTNIEKGSMESEENWRIVFVLAACVHLFGIVFYAVFASGELQDWAEPPSTGSVPQVWSPISGKGGQAETSFNGPTASTDTGVTPASYGAVQQVATNPFTNPFMTPQPQPVQPQSTDTYMHGSVEDRTY